MYFVNYITCALMAFAVLEPKSFFRGDVTPLRLGRITGLFYLASLAANGYSIHKNGAILSSVFTRLGVLVPILLSVTLFRERPSLLQGTGVALAVAAAVIMNGLPQKRDSSSERIFLLPLILTLLLNGISDAMSKVFTQLGNRQDDGLFIFYIFLFAGLATLVLLITEHQRIDRKQIFYGVLVGIPNFLSSRFLLADLTQLPAFLVYPSYSVGVILIISVASFILFHECLNHRQMVAAGMILAALVLLNL